MKSFILRVFVFVLIGVCLFAAVEITGRSLNVVKRPVFNIKAKSQNLVPQIDQDTILFIGDSRIEWGIKPTKFLEGFTSDNRLKAINLAFTDSNGIDVLRYLKNNRIHPQLIIIGHTPIACRYKNHGLDSEVYSNPRKLFLNAENYFRSNFLVSDNSIYQYYKNGPLTMKRLEYGPWGDVSASLTVSYEEAKKRQILLYTSWREK